MDGSEYEDPDAQLNVLRLALAMLAAQPGRTDAVRELLRLKELARHLRDAENPDER